MAGYFLILAMAFGCAQVSAVYRAGGLSSYMGRGMSYGGYDNAHTVGHHQMPGYGSSGNMYNTGGYSHTDHVHTGAYHTHSDHCSCSVGEVCTQDRHGHPFCQPNGHLGTMSTYGTVRGSGQCYSLAYPTRCLRPLIPGAITRYTFRNGGCVSIIASNVDPTCQPQGMYNNIFRSHYLCQKACLY